MSLSDLHSVTVFNRATLRCCGHQWSYKDRNVIVLCECAEQRREEAMKIRRKYADRVPVSVLLVDVLQLTRVSNSV